MKRGGGEGEGGVDGVITGEDEDEDEDDEDEDEDEDEDDEDEDEQIWVGGVYYE